MDLPRVEHLYELSPNRLHPSWQKIELGCVINASQDCPTFVVFVHREQNLLKAVHQRQSQIFSDGEKVTWERLRFCQDSDVRFSNLIQRVIVIIADRTGRHLS